MGRASFDIQKFFRTQRWVLPVLLAVIAILLLVFPSTLMEYAQDRYYQPEGSVGKGYVGKVNAMLAQALRDERLDFQYASDSASVRLAGIRLSSAEDSTTYFNTFGFSDLRHDTLLPEGHPGTIFKVHMDKKQIKKVEADPLSRRVRLSQKLWTGTLRSNVSMKGYVFFEHMGEQFPLRPCEGCGRTADPGDRLTVHLNDNNRSFEEYMAHFLRSNTASIMIGEGPSAGRLGQYLECIADTEGKLYYRVINEDARHPFRVHILDKKDEVIIKRGTDTILERIPHYLRLDTDQGTTMIRVDTSSTYSILSYAHHTERGIKRINSLIKGGVDRYTNQLMDVLPAYLSDIDGSSNSVVDLSIDPYQGIHYQNALESYAAGLERNGSNSVQVGLVLMDPCTGEIISAPYYDTKQWTDSLSDSYNINFKNKPVGSAFKPIWLSACLLSNPSLHRFTLQWGTSTSLNGEFVKGKKGGRVDVLGYSLPTFHEWNLPREVDLSTALRRSSNVYPVAVGLIALAHPRDPTKHHEGIRYEELSNAHIDWLQVNRHGLLRNNQPHTPHLRMEGDEIHPNNFASSLPAQALTEIYYTRDGRAVGWRGIHGNDHPGRLGVVSPDEIDLHLGSKDILVSPLNVRQNLVSLILGDGDAYINNVKLVESYARLLTKRRIVHSFILNKESPPSLMEGWREALLNDGRIKQYVEGLPLCSADAQEAAWDVLINALRAPTGVGGTAEGAGSRVRAISQKWRGNSDDLVVLGKTGTPNWDTIRTKPEIEVESRGLFVFHLVDRQNLEALTATRGNDPLPSRCGVVGVISITSNGSRVVGSGDAVSLFERLVEDIYLMNRERFRVRDGSGGPAQ